MQMRDKRLHKIRQLGRKKMKKKLIFIFCPDILLIMEFNEKGEKKGKIFFFHSFD